MANNGKYLAITSGVVTEENAINTSAGAGDAGKIPKLDASGTLPVTMLPAGVGPETVVLTTSEALSAGDFVNIHISTGVKVRKADATVAGKEAHGFVIAAFGAAVAATVYHPSQTNTAVSGKTPGAKQYLSTTPGATTETAPSASGNIVQSVGMATSATAIIFDPYMPITLA